MMTPLELIPEAVIAEGRTWTLALNRNQNLLGKTMLVLNRPCSAVTDLRGDEWASLHDELQQLTPVLSALFEPDQFNYAFLMNQDPQVHLHVIPRYEAPRTWDGLVFEDLHWGRSFGPEQRPLEQDRLAKLATAIRGALSPPVSSG